jgi:hypothetical protein
LPDEGRTLRSTTSEMRVQVPPSRFTFHLSAMNRIACYFDESTDTPPYGDFVVVFGDFGRFGVSHEVARQIVAALDQWFVPTWIEFSDRVGSLVRVRSREIRALVESTATQRAADRRLERARNEEENEDRRPWDNDPRF